MQIKIGQIWEVCKYTTLDWNESAKFEIVDFCNKEFYLKCIKIIQNLDIK